MLLTPKEAAEKWCPQSMGEDVRWPKCQGSDCMAWRWNSDLRRGLSDVLKQESRPMRGYCGLAGKPEGA